MSENGQGKPEENDQLISVSLGVIFLVLPFVIFAYVLAFHDLPFGGPETWATFGDYFSGIMTPVAAVVSVAILCRTLVIQQREMKNTVKELQRAAEINQENLEQQKRIFRLQELNSNLDKIKHRLYKSEHIIGYQNPDDIFEFMNNRHILEHNGVLSCSRTTFLNVLVHHRDNLVKFYRKQDVDILEDLVRSFMSDFRIFTDYLRLGGHWRLISEEREFISMLSDELLSLLDSCGRLEMRSILKDELRALRLATRDNARRFSTEVSNIYAAGIDELEQQEKAAVAAYR